MKQTITALLIAATALQGCSKAEKQITAIDGGNIQVTATDRADGAEEVREILKKYSAAIDSIKAPVIGTAAVELTVSPPESPLMNFAADALLATAQQHSSKKIDIAITNKGGLRSTIQKGNITYGDLYNVFPFDNYLALLTLTGEQLTELFKDIAKVGGEAISGARLTITADGELIDATVGGKSVEPEREYLIATSDYLSQGNDKLYTLGKGSNIIFKEEITIRDLMIQYVSDLHKEGKAVSATTDGRITIK
ncbi:MAG: 5'-nucleotidase C-terminal domain-containing protein [Bacteroidaceae bacterium]|nr:5'-nucleotidase C-terminal domain-containing protein [Bacteroidaceae bacterium]